ncbi:PBP1A family penicillin-binding protein [Caldanaerobius polysaccharolyticus]|uniref:PBP1A family penicillin-binding protein n=1 Tax=Caldanaerobius polysaccharolyticus TaxID=44256 RepID=UPI000690F469|nr:PBP1A family penicillin-binding protein [Caldanaerobius polysaccharolyticus]
MAETRSSVKSKRKKRISVLRVALLIIVALLAIAIGAAGGKVMAIISSTPKLSPDALLEQNLSTSVYAKDANGNWQRVALFHGANNRLWVSISKIPKDLQNAFIAIEDQRFREHHGIDIKRIFGALIADIKTRSFSEGGSTITQQLVKNTMLSSEKSLKRKIQEAVLAWQIENIYSKDQILEAYLNTIFLGNSNLNAYGVEAASLAYFGKDVSELDLAESALLAGINNNPSTNSPYVNPKKAKERQELVLYKMLENGFITREEYEKAKAEKLVYKKAEGLNDYQHQYFIDQVIQDVAAELQKRENISYNEALNKIYTGGYKIYTTMDLRIQDAIEQNFKNNRLFPKDEYVKNYQRENIIEPQGAMVVLDPKTGEVKGMVGGRGTQSGKFLLNRAVSRRQPGSAIKPITVYTPAIDNGYTAASVIDDAPVTFDIKGSGPWRPENYESGYYRGLVTLRTALQNSINVPAAKLVMTLGTQTSYEYGIRFGLGLSKADSLSPAALSLGALTQGVTPLEMAGAYGALANGGVYVKPITFTKVLDRNDNVVIDNRPSKRVVVSPQVAYIITNMMESVVKAGTGTNAALPNMAVAGKTGTTEDYHDAWFAGFTPKYVGVVWMGYDQPKTMVDRYGLKVVGGSYPAMMWRAVMQQIHSGMKYAGFTKPEGIVSAYVCKDSGDLPTDVCRQDPRGNRVYKEIFIQGTVPTTYCKVHVKAKIDISTNKLATDYCPPQFVQERVFINPPGRSPELNQYTQDGRYVVPSQTCDKHTSPSSINPDSGSNSSKETTPPESPGPQENPNPSNPQSGNQNQNQPGDNNTATPPSGTGEQNGNSTTSPGQSGQNQGENNNNSPTMQDNTSGTHKSPATNLQDMINGLFKGKKGQ